MERLPREPQVHQLDPDETDQRKAGQHRIGPRAPDGREPPEAPGCEDEQGDRAPEGEVLDAPTPDEGGEAGDLGFGREEGERAVSSEPGRHEAEGADNDGDNPDSDKSRALTPIAPEFGEQPGSHETDGRGPNTDGEAEADPGDRMPLSEPGTCAPEHEGNGHEIITRRRRCDPPPRREHDDGQCRHGIVVLMPKETAEQHQRNGCRHQRRKHEKRSPAERIKEVGRDFVRQVSRRPRQLVVAVEERLAGSQDVCRIDVGAVTPPQGGEPCDRRRRDHLCGAVRAPARLCGVRRRHHEPRRESTSAV